MLAFPETQRRVQEDIDGVVGQYRSPTLEYKRTLPYCATVFKETFRWQRVAILEDCRTPR